MVSRLDRDIGRIVDQVKALGIERETLVIFASDNGPAREGTHTPDFFHGSGPFRAMKGSLYEGGIRVPFVARWPGRITPGTTTDRMVAFWDVLPTVAELADLPIPAGLDGISFVPTLLGRAQPARESLYWEYTDQHFGQAVRLPEWKAVRPAPAAPIELYRLRDDLGEQHDRASEFPDLVKKVESIMQTSHADSPEYPRKP
jgi:arylsulfatase A-like enzyme